VTVKAKRKTEINLEIEEAIGIRTRRVITAKCPGCRRQVRMVSASEAAIIARLSAREIYRLVEDGRLHFIEDNSGLLFVCFASLDRLVNVRPSIRQ
jgi:hypothetical protein